MYLQAIKRVLEFARIESEAKWQGGERMDRAENILIMLACTIPILR